METLERMEKAIARAQANPGKRIRICAGYYVFNNGEATWELYRLEYDEPNEYNGWWGGCRVGGWNEYLDPYPTLGLLAESL